MTNDKADELTSIFDLLAEEVRHFFPRHLQDAITEARSAFESASDGADYRPAVVVELETWDVRAG